MNTRFDVLFNILMEKKILLAIVRGNGFLGLLNIQSYSDYEHDICSHVVNASNFFLSSFKQVFSLINPQPYFTLHVSGTVNFLIPLLVT